MLKNSAFLQKWFVLFFAATIVIFSQSKAQTLINGNLSTGNTSSNGTTAPTGFNWSEVQNGNTSFGFGASIASNLALVENFTVPSGQIWNLTNLLVFAYSTNYSGATSPFNDFRVRIYNTDPSLGTATPIFGDLTTNRFASSSSTNIYRIAYGTPGQTRLVWGIVGNLPTTLNPGQYWIEWQLGTVTGVTSNFCPPSTVAGTISQPGNNAWQHNVQTNVWTPVVDQGSSTRQDLPFVLNYTISVPPNCTGTPAPGNTISTNTNVCPGQDFTLTLQNNPVLSGLTYQWQSSSDGTTWTDIPGANTESFVANQGSNTYYRCLVTCSGNTAPSAPVLVSMYTSLISAQPVNEIAGCSQPASFRVVTGGTSPVLGYQWQQRANTGSAWQDVTNTNLIKGVNNDTLTFLSAPASLNGYQFRVLYLDTCENVIASDSAILTVTPITANITPATATVCNNTAQILSLTGTQTTLSTFASGNITPPLSIPDTVKAGVKDTVAVSGIPAGSAITSISVKINATHTYVGDLAVILKSPNGSIINLDYYLSGTNEGPSATGFVNTVFSSNGSFLVGDSTDPYTGVFRADQVVTPSANFPAGPNSMAPTTANWADLFSNPNGDWVLGLYDGFTGDVGTLDSWSIDLTYSLPATGVWSGTQAGTIFTDATATTAYVSGSTVNTVYVRPASSTTYSAVTSSPACGSSAPTTVDITVEQAIGNLTGPADTSVCAGNPVSFSVSAAQGSNISYQWQFSTDGGNTWQNISGANAASVNIASGAYSTGTRFRAVLSNPCGAPLNSAAATYTILSGPSILTQPANSSACAGSQASYSVNSPGSTSFQWQVSTDNGNTWNNVPSGGSTSNYSFTASASDNGKIYRAVVGACGSFLNSASASFTILASATITTQPSNTAVCAGSSASISAVATGSSYQWQVSTDNGNTWSDITGANTTTLNITSVSSVQNGNRYRLVIGNCGASTINSNSAVLTVIQPASITTQPAAFSACEGANATVTVTASGTGLAYQWEISTDNGSTWNNISGAQSASYTVNTVALSANGNLYRVIISAAAPCGSVTSGTALLTVNPIPTVGANVSPGDIVCAGTSITLSGTGAATYSWNNGVSNGVPFAINNTTTYSVAGTSAAGCLGTADVTINVNPNPTVSVTASGGTVLAPGQSVTLTATSTPTAATYTWYRNGQVIPGATANTYTVTNNSAADLGAFYAVATTSDGCQGQSSLIDVSATILSLLSPNPTTGSFVVSMPGQSGSGAWIISLYDSKGALVFQNKYNYTGSTPIQVVTRGLSSGVYTVDIRDVNGKRQVSKKIVISLP